MWLFARRSGDGSHNTVPSVISGTMSSTLTPASAWRRRGLPSRESRGIEERKIHRGRAIRQPLGDETARRGGMLEAMATETHGEKQALDAGGPPDDGVIVRRQRTEPRPAAPDAGLPDEGQPMQRLLDGFFDLGPVDR